MSNWPLPPLSEKQKEDWLVSQDEFNRTILALLGRTAHELRRSTRSHDWEDMVGLQDAIELLQARLPREH